MKKSLLALAVLSAFAGVASAQSSITLYGRVDAGYTRFDPKQGTTSDVSATSGLAAGNLGGNRFGIRGSEDLGGGLRGIFALENGFSIDTGATAQGDAVVSSRLFGRQAWLGLTGGFGSVVMGRIPSFSSGTGDFDKFGSLDPFRTGAGILGFQKVMSSANSLRLDNAVAYMTPTMGGFSAGVGYTFNYTGGEAAGGSGNNNTGYVAYVNFGSGPFYGVITYDDFDLGGLANDPNQTHLQAGLSWDFKWAKISFAYAKEESQFVQGIAGACIVGDPTVSSGCTANAQRTLQAAGADAEAMAVGLIVPFGAHSIRAAYHTRDVDSVGTTPEAERTGWSLGYEYAFSRRTTFYVYYGDVSDKKAYKIANWGGATQGFLGLSHAF